MTLKIYTRKEWGAKYGIGWSDRSSSLPADFAFLHHSVTATLPADATLAQDMAAVRNLDDIGYDRFKQYDKGWKRPKGAGISYTWAVTPSGRAFEGHDPKLFSSHTAGYNKNGIGICLVGNYETYRPTQAQLRTVADLLSNAVDKGILKNAKLNGGHRDVYNTSCPGDYAYNKIEEINNMVKQTFDWTDDVEFVKWLQTSLKAVGFDCGEIDGIAGANTLRALGAFQRSVGLEDDEIPGPATKAALNKALDGLRGDEVQRKIDSMRISGDSRWSTAQALVLAEFPAGKGVLVVADGTPDATYAVTRANDNIRVVPVRVGNDSPPRQSIAATKAYAPKWVRFVGGSDVVTNACAKAVLESVNLL